MDRRDFLKMIGAIYGVTLTPLTSTGEIDYVAAAEAVDHPVGPATIEVPVAFLDAVGVEHLRRPILFTVATEGTATVFKQARPYETWEAVPPGDTFVDIVACFPLAPGIEHRLIFPRGAGLPLLTNGGDLNIATMAFTWYS